jgi:hypothetical protein
MGKTVVHSNRFHFPMRIILIIIALIILAGILIGYTLYNKPQRSVESEKAIAISAIQLFKEFEENETDANTKYLNKAVLVSGVISEINSNQEGKTVLILETENPMFGVSCTLEDQAQGLSTGASVTVKGICTGYLSDVVVTRGIIPKNEK